jgi:hypothetical protein
MNSNRCLIGAWLAAVILMSGSLAVAQDSNATVIQDVYVLAHNPDTNYATQDLLRAGSPPEDDWEQLIYVQFDLSPLPEGMHVKTATLSLFNHLLEWANREYTDFGIKAVTSAWDENDVTFATRPTLDDTTIYDSVTFVGENTGPDRVDTEPEIWVNWDVTDLVQAWSDGSLENNGLAVVWNGGDPDLGSLYPRFRSMQYLDDESLWPMLDVTFGSDQGDGLKGDVNDDTEVNGLDVDPFVDVLLNGTTDTDMEYRADVNDDGIVNGLDVDPFVELVVGGGVAAVPEPSSLVLLLCGVTSLLGVAIRRRR